MNNKIISLNWYNIPPDCSLFKFDSKKSPGKNICREQAVDTSNQAMISKLLFMSVSMRAPRSTQLPA